MSRAHKDPNPVDRATAVGVDVGATLAKLACRDSEGALHHQLLPAADPDGVAAAVSSLGSERIGLTGAGSAALATRLIRAGSTDPIRVMEFAAWGAGAAQLLREQGHTGEDPYLLVSVGTGTSVMLVDGLAVNRVGGTALGGGTVVGLGAGLVGCRDFEQIAKLAREGDRRRVDLLVSDIYRPGEIPLTGDITASSFGKLGRAGRDDPAGDADLAHAIMSLVGENVVLVCAGLAAAAASRRIVFGGSTLRENPALVDVLRAITAAIGLEAIFLEGGEFAGAVGALALAQAS